MLHSIYKHLTALGLCVGIGLLLTAWANQAASSTAARIMLLGEVHDNPDGHRQRTDALRGEVEGGFRPALLMEQFDRENQAALTQAQVQCRDADCVIAAAGGKRWDWPLYKPVIELALRYRLPLIAANVSRADAGKVIGGGLPAALEPETIRQFKLDQALPTDLAKGQRQAIIDGHCGKFPEEMVPGMVNAQVARDVWMAKLLAEHSTNGAVLLAGNGHVRKDVGVPRWLSLVTSIKPHIHGYVEKAEPGDAAAYDVTHVIPPASTAGSLRRAGCAGQAVMRRRPPPPSLRDGPPPPLKRGRMSGVRASILRGLRQLWGHVTISRRSLRLE